MNGTWGNNIQLTIYGESHGVAIGGVLCSLHPGLKLDFEKIDKEMKRRNHRAFYSTARDEKDEYELLSGVTNGIVNGAPLSFCIRNKEQHSADYQNLNQVPRPGHADFPAAVKYCGYNDYRGGGHFSGRITAPLTFAGAVAKQYLDTKGIQIVSHIASIGDICTNQHLPLQYDKMLSDNLFQAEFPLLDESLLDTMCEKIRIAKSEGDSVGGVIECAVYNLPAGIGNPFFGSVESRLSEMLYSIPAVKGVEFGEGFSITKMRGSCANDNYYTDGQKVYTKTNHNGGILGGITNGMPVIFRVAIKPTPSVFKEQATVNLENMTPEIMRLKGRHDACIVPRALAVVEAAAALVFLDLMGENIK